MLACMSSLTKRSTSLAKARAHQAAPQASNSWPRRCRLRPSMPVLRPLRASPCRRQAPICAARPSTAGVQKPVCASGDKPSPLIPDSSNGPAARKARPAKTCSAKLNRNAARCCRYSASHRISRPVPPHTAAAATQGRTNSTARLINTRPTSITSDRAPSRRRFSRICGSRAASSMPAISPRPTIDAASKPNQPALKPLRPTSESSAICPRNSSPPSNCTVNAL